MRYRDLASYRRSLKSMGDAPRLEAIGRAVSDIIACFERRTPPPAGLGLKQLRPPLWEVRASREDRVVFSWGGGLITFLAAGTHDDAKRLLGRS